AAPYRRGELDQGFARDGDDAAFDLVAPCGCTVEHDSVGLACGAANLNRFLHRVDVKHARPRGYHDHGGVLDRIVDHSRKIRRRVDEDPFEAVALGGRDDPAHGIDGGLD